MFRMKNHNKRKTNNKLIKRIGMAVLTCALLGCLTACDPADKPSSKDRASSPTEQTEADVLPILKPEDESTDGSKQNADGSNQNTDGAGTGETGDASKTEDPITLRVGSLKGPTTMGLLFLMADQKNGKTKNDYEFQMATGADELLPLMVSGKLDAALVPANVAAILCQKTNGNVVVVNVNTLGVLYLVSSDDSVKGIEDLKGRTIYLTGKGTTPDCVIQYLLKQAGYAEGDVKLEYKSEATEVAAILSQTEDALGFLPQPFVTAASMQNDKLKIVFSANDEWKKAQGTDDASGLVTGVTVVRKEVVEEHPEAIKTFLEEHAASAAAINADPDTGAAYCVEAGIVAKEPIAKKAIPYCNVTCLTGKEMKQALQSYLEILYDFDKTTVGGALPGEDFYYLP